MLYLPAHLPENSASPLVCVPHTAIWLRANYRQQYDTDFLIEVAGDMALNGFRTADPVKAYCENGQYTVIDGNTRFIASLLASWLCLQTGGLAIPVWTLVENKPDRGNYTLRQMQENEDNRQPDILSQGTGYQAMLDAGIPLETICASLHHSADYVNRRLALLKLIPLAQEMAGKGHLPIGIGNLLSQLNNEYQRVALNTYVKAGKPSEESFKPIVDDLLTKQNQCSLFDLALFSGSPIPSLENTLTVEPVKTRAQLEKELAAEKKARALDRQYAREEYRKALLRITQLEKELTHA